jgi:tRNA acetyltransferase TAN1
MQYSIDAKSRNNTKLDKDAIIQAVADEIGPEHSVNLKEPEKTIIAYVYKSTCGMSIVDDYVSRKRLSVVQENKETF